MSGVFVAGSEPDSGSGRPATLYVRAVNCPVLRSASSPPSEVHAEATSPIVAVMTPIAARAFAITGAY